MSEIAARTLAAGLLGVVALVVRFIRKDKLYVIPNGQEVRDMAKALIDVQRNHFTWIGAGYEFFALIGAVGSYGRRALTEKPANEPNEPTNQPQPTPPNAPS